MPEGTRADRVSEEIREVLAEEIPKLKDPRIGFVTVTGVKVTPDIRHAWVRYTVFGDERDRAGTRAGLRSATPFLRGAIGKQVRLKAIPEIEFEEDASIKLAERIDQVIEEIHRTEGA